MDYERYEGSRGQEILVNETDIVVMKDGQWLKTYYFDNYSIRVETTNNSFIGAAVGGLLGAAIASGVSANYQLHITNLDGKTEKVPLYFSGKEVNRLEQHIKEINLKKAKAKEKEIYSCKHTFAGYPMSSYIGRLVFIWLFFGGLIVLWIKVFHEDMFDWSNIDAVMWIVPAFFLLVLAFCTIVTHALKKQMLVSIEINPEKLIIDQKQFEISKIREIKVASASNTAALPAIKFEYEGKKYNYTLCHDWKTPALNSPAMNKEYQEILFCFRTIYKDKSEVLVSGF